MTERVRVLNLILNLYLILVLLLSTCGALESVKQLLEDPILLQSNFDGEALMAAS